MLEGRVVDSNMDCFSSNFFVVLVNYLEVGGDGLGLVVGNAVFVNWTKAMTIVFFYSIFQTSVGLSGIRKVTIFFYTGPFVYYVLF